MWPAVVHAAYADTRELAAAETGLPIDTFPCECPYADSLLLDEQCLPPTESGN